MAALTDKLATALRAALPFLDALHADNTRELAASGREALAEHDRAKPGEPLTIAYIAMGAARALHKLSRDDAERVLDGLGEDGFIDTCIAHAAMIDALWESLPERVRGGWVWDYEITEPFGALLVTQSLEGTQHIATPEQARAMAEQLVADLKETLQR